MKVTCEGMYFNKRDGDYTNDDPETEMVIDKAVLDRSTGMFLGRFDFEIEQRTKLVFTVEFDGVKVDKYGTNLPYQETSGKYTTILFKYPNSAKANKKGDHKVRVKYGLISGIIESKEDLVNWKDAEAVGEATFVIKLI